MPHNLRVADPKGDRPVAPTSLLRPLRSLRLIIRFLIFFGCGFAALSFLRLILRLTLTLHRGLWAAKANKATVTASNNIELSASDQ